MPKDEFIRYSELDAKVTLELWERLSKIPGPPTGPTVYPGPMPSPGHEHEDGGPFKRRRRL